MSTMKALGAIEFSNVHRIWSDFFSINDGGIDVPHTRLKALEEEAALSIAYVFNCIYSISRSKLKTNCRNPLTSFLGARYYRRAREMYFNERRSYPLLKTCASHYVKIASQLPDAIEWSNLNSCIDYFFDLEYDGYENSITESQAMGLVEHHSLYVQLLAPSGF